MFHYHFQKYPMIQWRDANKAEEKRKKENKSKAVKRKNMKLNESVLTLARAMTLKHANLITEDVIDKT